MSERRQGESVQLSTQFLELMERLRRKLALTQFKEATGGIGDATLIGWRRQMRAKSGALAVLCKGLNCTPEDLLLPPATICVVQDFLQVQQWNPDSSRPNLLLQLDVRV